jgi:hypothetical protein
MAFLQRVLNGGGHIERDCGAGRGRMDLGIEYKDYFYIVEIKMIRDYDGPQAVRKEGLEQIREYREKFAPGAPAYLAIFDRRSKTERKSWEERITFEKDEDVVVLGC